MPDPDKITIAIHGKKDAAAVGAGWLLPGGDVITCAHVIDAARKASGSAKFWVRPIGSKAKLREYYVHDHDPVRRAPGPASPYEGDLALLKRQEGSPPLEPERTFPPRLPRHGEEVVAFGFPTSVRAGGSGYGRIGTASSVGRFEILETERKEHSLTQGFSGAPVMSAERNNVLGLFVSTLDDAARGYLIPSQFVSDWLGSIGARTHFFGEAAEWPTGDVRRIRKAVFGEQAPAVTFDVRVRQEGSATPELAQSYGEDELDPERFVWLVDQKENPLLIKSEGGGGKSSFLFEVVTELHEAGTDFLWLDLKRLRTAGATERCRALLDRVDANAGAVMEGICGDTCEVYGWSEKLKGTRLLVVIADGLNEVGSDAQRLLEALFRFVRSRAQTRLVATVRTTTRLDTPRDMLRFEVVPLPAEAIAAVTGQDVSAWRKDLVSLLSKPQMLSIALATGEFSPARRSEMFTQFFDLVVAKAKESRPNSWLASAEPEYLLGALGALSFDMLRRGAATLALPEEDWNRRLARALPPAGDGEGGAPAEPALLTEELLEQGVVARTGPAGQATLSFQHALYQEWLAVRHFIGLPHHLDWTNSGFTAISLEDSSDDGLRLALEMVAPPDRSYFLMQMYDWRWQRVIALVAVGVEDLSVDLVDALIGVNGLRLLDPFKHSRESVEAPIRALAGRGHEFATTLLDAATAGGETAVLGAVRARFSEREFDQDAQTLLAWTKLLDLTPPIQTPAASHLTYLNGFLGWSASNLFRVIGYSETIFDMLWACYEGSYITARSISYVDVSEIFDPREAGVGFRWRLVHTCGRGLAPESVDAAIWWLNHTWRRESEHRDVRFGACRSLLEIALGHEASRPAIFEGFVEGLAAWAAHDGPDRTWRDDAFRAAEQLWRAGRPAEGVLEPEALAAWNASLRDVLRQAKETGTALGWRLDALEAALTGLGEADEGGQANGG